MKQFFVSAALAAALAAQAHTLSYDIVFTPEASGASGSGTGSVVIDTDAWTMVVSANFAGLSGNTTASHIHCCTPTAGNGTAGVATPVPSFPDFPAGVTMGSYMHEFDMTQVSSYNPAFVTANGGTVDAAFAALLTGIDAGKAYWNVHTSTFGGGEIRGFLVAAPVPEPAAWASMLLGLAAIASLRRRRA